MQDYQKLLRVHDLQLVNCTRCERLVAWREEIGRRKTRAYRDWTYWARPVVGLGDINAQVLVVGLAPGAHGSNRTGRMFTGDGSGDFLFPALYRAGFANQPTSTQIDDGLKLENMYITAVCRCVPPDNKPARQEIKNCMPYLIEEIKMMNQLKVIVTLGSIAHNEVIRIYQGTAAQKIHKFSHNNLTLIEDPNLAILSSYHPSRQNTQTGRLTIAMFDEIWQQVQDLLTRL